MADKPKTRKDLEIALIMKAWKDGAFRQELQSNPKAAVAKVTGQPLADDVQVVVHEETAKTIHLVVPAKPAILDELSEEQLGAMAGGVLQQEGAMLARIVQQASQVMQQASQLAQVEMEDVQQLTQTFDQGCIGAVSAFK